MPPWKISLPLQPAHQKCRRTQYEPKTDTSRVCFEVRVCRDCRIELQIPGCRLDLQTRGRGVSQRPRWSVRDGTTDDDRNASAPRRGFAAARDSSPQRQPPNSFPTAILSCNFGPASHWPAASLPLVTTIPCCKTRLQFAAKNVFKAQRRNWPSPVPESRSARNGAPKLNAAS